MSIHVFTVIKILSKVKQQWRDSFSLGFDNFNTEALCLHATNNKGNNNTICLSIFVIHYIMLKQYTKGSYWCSWSTILIQCCLALYRFPSTTIISLRGSLACINRGVFKFRKFEINFSIFPFSRQNSC